MPSLRLTLERRRARQLALYVSCLKRFEFLRDEGCVETSPMERVHRPRLLPAEERDVVTISDDDVTRMKPYG